jgi:hypothetical protein
MALVTGVLTNARQNDPAVLSLQVTHLKLEKLRGQADFGCSVFCLVVFFLTTG